MIPEHLQDLTYWHWWTLGICLLILEMLGVGGFLIGLASAAVVVGLLMVVGLISTWQVELVVFAALAVCFTLLYWKYFRQHGEDDAASALNHRAVTLVGRQFVASAPVSGGHGRLQFGDTFWEVSSTDELLEGDHFIVDATDGMILSISKVSSPG